MSIDEELAEALRVGLGITDFVETGTYKCGTVKWAEGKFATVTTIESYEPYYRLAQENNPDLVAAGVKFIYGDSRTELPKVLRKLRGPALLWLDAHWMGNSKTSQGTLGECPIREELTALAKTKYAHCILVDDAHLFCGDNPSVVCPEQWPRYEEMTRVLNSGAHKFYTIVHEDMIIYVPLGKAVDIVKKHIDAPTLDILVLTSNKYAHVCLPFAHHFNRAWGQIPATVMRYDVRPPKLPPNFNNRAMGNQSDFSWSSGLRSYVQQFVPGDLVLLLLEDYYFTQPVNVALITQLWNWMLENPTFAKLDLSGDRLKTPYIMAGEAFGVQIIESAPEANYQASLQAAIWRKDFLLDTLVNGETPWEFEKRGTRRIMAAREAGKFAGRILGTSPALLHYVNAVGGEGRSPGIYDTRKMPREMIDEMRGYGWL
jgi:hypothetical protein